MPICEVVHILDTQDKEKVALWQITQDDAPITQEKPSVFLSHGAFSDRRICLGVAKYLAHHGYTCFVLEWRGHGSSPSPSQPFDLEMIALYDYKAAFDYLRHTLNIARLHCITHSGGGLCLTMFLLHYPKYKNGIQSISLLACQAFGAAIPLGNRTKLRIAKTFTRLLGYIPAKRLKLGLVNESYHTMQPWFDWNLETTFTSRDKTTDYQAMMPAIKIPIYAISGTADKFIAPSEGCRLYLAAFDNAHNVFREFGIMHGDLEDYSHSRLALSKNASQEIWTTLLQWMCTHPKNRA